MNGQFDDERTIEFWSLSFLSCIFFLVLNHRPIHILTSYGSIIINFNLICVIKNIKKDRNQDKDRILA